MNGEILEVSRAVPPLITRLLRLGSVFLCVCLLHGNQPGLPAQGVVQDEKAACRIGLAVFESVLGEDRARSFTPYHAALKKDVWTVYGTPPRNQYGGVPELRMRRSDAKILEIWHSM